MYVNASCVGAKVCLVGLAQTKIHYSFVAKKLGYPVNDNFTYVCAVAILKSQQSMSFHHARLICSQLTDVNTLTTSTFPLPLPCTHRFTGCLFLSR